MKKVIIILSCAWAAACASNKLKSDTTTIVPQVPAVKTLPTSLEEAVGSDRRTAKNKERDVYRHPQQTLEFFDIQPNQTVIEISPATGWYTEILAPFLATQGHYIGALRKADLNDSSNGALKAWGDQNADVMQKASFVEFNADHLSLGEDSSADRVVTFRNVHNWMQNKTEKQVFKSFFAVLKPGGILGIVEHRAAQTQKEKRGENGYVSEKTMIDLAKAAGFKLLARSEINANPKDTKNYPDGVWDLPPTLRLKDKDREKYLAIGESDRMTLSFVKPGK